MCTVGYGGAELYLWRIRRNDGLCSLVFAGKKLVLEFEFV